MVRICTGLCCHIPCFLPCEPFLIDEKTHQLRHCHGRVGIIHLNRYLFVEFTHITVFLFILFKHCLQACGNKEILLFQTKLFSCIVIVIRIQYIYDQFCKILLLYGFVIISSVKCVQLEICDRLCIPHTQCIDYVITVSHDRHIIWDCKYGFIIFLYKDIFSCLRIFVKMYISSEAHFFCIFLAAQLKRISFFEPVIRCLHLITIFYFLLKHSIAVTDSTSVCRIIQSRQ